MLYDYCKLYLYLPVLDCDDDVIQEWQKEEVEALKPKEHGSFIPQHLLTIIRENSFWINICFWATELDIDLSYSITIPAR